MKEVIMKEFYNRFEMRVLESHEDFDQYYELRYQVYCIKYPWLPQNPFEIEIDRYDKLIRSKDSNSFAIGVFDGPQMVAQLSSNCLVFHLFEKQVGLNNEQHD